jgi:hypothetical protein
VTSVKGRGIFPSTPDPSTLALSDFDIRISYFVSPARCAIRLKY